MMHDNRYMCEISLNPTSGFDNRTDRKLIVQKHKLKDIYINWFVVDEEHIQSNFLQDEQRGLAVFLEGVIVDDDANIVLKNPIAHIKQNRIPSGLFNLVCIDANHSTVTIFNDIFGNLPLYYNNSHTNIVFSNSLFLIKSFLSPSLNPQGFAERYALTFTVNDKTVFEGIYRTQPGSRYEFRIESAAAQHSTRLAETWSTCQSLPVEQALHELKWVWDQAVDRWIPNETANIGLMLSGGLDSRLVLGGLLDRNLLPVACTHGDEQSVEFALAQEMCQAFKLSFIPNPMNAELTFANLAIDKVLELTDLIFNPIWYRSLVFHHKSNQGYRRASLVRACVRSKHQLIVAC